MLANEAARSKHLSRSTDCKTAHDTAMNAFRRRRDDARERGEPLNLHTAARECVQAIPAPPAPPVSPTQKRRRVQVEEVADVDSNKQSPAQRPPPGAAPNVPTPRPTSTIPPATNPSASATAPNTSGPGAPPTAQGATPPGWIDPRTGWYVEPFPDPLAGAPISDNLLPPVDLEVYMRSSGEMGKPEYFEMAELLLMTGLTDSGKNKHLSSVLYRGSTLPWKNTTQLYTDVDQLKHGPVWHLYEINIKNMLNPDNPHVQYLVMRNIVNVVRDMMANPAFHDLLKYAPETYWTSEEKTERVFGDMWSVDWWPRMQEELRRQGKRDGTIAALVIATDQTKLASLCGGQKAYPVYITLGNIGKDGRRQPTKHATVLLGFLPVDGFEDIANDDERRRMKADLVHRAMETMFAPLVAASKTGVEMRCMDGRLRRMFPLVAAYMADWPKQNLQSCTTEGSCPVCTTKRKGRWELSDEPAPLRDRDETLRAIRVYCDFHRQRDLKAMGLKPVWPWWASLDHVNLATCMTPDLLHQLYQGIFKTHLVRWLQFLVGIKELDARFVSTTQAAEMRHFGKGISHVQQWTGRESKEMLKQIVPLVAGTLKPPELSQLVLSAVDFIYQAHSSSMTNSEINELDATLETFHRLKVLMVEQGFYGSSARFDRIPKLHMLMHYSHAIRELGTPDGYNTEAPEHLHIEYAKEPWRASNKVRPMKQMITYIQRQEAIRIHRTYVNEWLKATTGWEPEPRRRLSWDEVEVEVEVVEDEDEEDLVEVAEVVGIVSDGHGTVIDGVHEVGGVTDSADIAQPVVENIGGVTGSTGSTGSAEGNSGIVSGGSDLLPQDAMYYPNPRLSMAKAPTKPNLWLKDVTHDYGATDLISATTDFLVNRAEIPHHDTLLSNHSRINVWHRLHLHHDRLPFAPLEPLRRDIVRASPTTLDAAGCVCVAGVWDTVLFKEWPNRPGTFFRRPFTSHHTNRFALQCMPAMPQKNMGLDMRYRPGRVCAFFSLPVHICHYYPGQLAYLKLFSTIDAGISSFLGLNSTHIELTPSGRRRTLVVPVTDIILACHLSPKFHMLDKELKLNSQTDLFALSKHFWINHFYSHYMYHVVQHWRKQPAPSLSPNFRNIVLRWNLHSLAAHGLGASFISADTLFANVVLPVRVEFIFYFLHNVCRPPRPSGVDAWRESLGVSPTFRRDRVLTSFWVFADVYLVLGRAQSKALRLKH
ncbi:hypothetical protein FRC10_008489 [Ceratobasidium sp. 414]|nr:hypothetical protein FRC10_008489 [Ceratobasidium sp. 414]